MPTNAPAKVEPVCIGPTWQTDANHPSKYAHPERSIGWAAQQWAFDWLRLSDGEPWRCTEEQGRFVKWWYAVDERGRFVYRDGVFQRLKGHGKDPLGAVLCAIEFLGPCRYDANGVDDLPVALLEGGHRGIRNRHRQRDHLCGTRAKAHRGRDELAKGA